MHIIHSDEPLSFAQPTIFLAGPTPRKSDVVSWRILAVEILESLRFQGLVLLPEPSGEHGRCDYYDQVEWEYEGLERANVVAFWVPRDLRSLPGFTSNVEFGRYVGSGRCVYGRPSNAPHTRYLDWLYTKFTNKEPVHTLRSVLEAALKMATAAPGS